VTKKFPSKSSGYRQKKAKRQAERQKTRRSKKHRGSGDSQGRPK